ncbi:hypothetical protein [Mycobacterium sp. E3305]|uniref:hypothetical protein n=1 Tax=Mycobacterium sp. E3305 TaxID=1834145 RepID=UPI001E5D4676|nr:hypothetical protein [Mycobacterium sp. E3305]
MHAAQLARGIALVANDSADRPAGLKLLAEARSAALAERFILGTIPIIDLHFAADKARTMDLDGAIALSRRVITELRQTGPAIYLGAATSVLVESLLRGGNDEDLIEAYNAIEALAEVPVEAGFVVYQPRLLKMRALLARAQDDAQGYRAYADQYVALAHTLGFKGDIAHGLALGPSHRSGRHLSGT